MDHGLPLFIGVVVAQPVVRRGKAEIAAQGRRDVLVQGTTAVSTVIHVDTDTAMVYGDSYIGIVIAQRLGHLLPMIGGRTEVSEQVTIRRAVVGV